MYFSVTVFFKQIIDHKLMYENNEIFSLPTDAFQGNCLFADKVLSTSHPMVSFIVWLRICSGKALAFFILFIALYVVVIVLFFFKLCEFTNYVSFLIES